MKYLLCVALLACAASAHAFDCPKGTEDYYGEIIAIRHQEEPLKEKIDKASDTATLIKLVKQFEALDDRISAVLQRMNECDAIGQSILKDVNN